MIPRPAQYLLRFDDLCPTFSRVKWEMFLPLVEKFHLRPILAVVPDNRDPSLILSKPDAEFWGLMRAMESAGSTIAVNGYQHACDSRGRGLIRLHSRTEFAGVPQEIQQEWIHKGVETLRSHGLHPKLWIAPRHGFDRNTLRALQQEGIGYLSDGFARIPFNRGGIMWIPQQLWQPVRKSAGLWTICIHSNFAGKKLVEKLWAFLEAYGAQFTSFDRVQAEFRAAALGPSERLYEGFSSWRIRLLRSMKQN
jgi:predicted deacetylase